MPSVTRPVAHFDDQAPEEAWRNSTHLDTKLMVSLSADCVGTRGYCVEVVHERVVRNLFACFGTEVSSMPTTVACNTT